MAQKRMFSKQIVSSDAFMDMPQSTQLLYFHLNMEADDDGFIGNARRVMKMIGAAEDDIKILLAKRFVLQFENSICVIKHWLIHNYIQADRYHETQYLDQKKKLTIKDNKAYTELKDGEAPKLKAGDDSIPEWVDRDAWGRWLKYKKERREKMPQSTIDFQLKRLENLGKEIHVELIDQAIAKGWRGFYPLQEGRDDKKITRDI